MPFLKAIKTQVNRTFSIQFSTPTEDIFTLETALKYINPSCSCSIVPGIENSCLIDPWKLLLQVLPHTTNCMVDIMMPYVEVTKKKMIVRHAARYILCDRQLVGVRIKPTEYWPKSRTIKQQIPSSLQNFYLQQGMTTYQRQIPIGQLLIMTQHFKMAPLFVSELTSMFETTTINLLNDYYNLGCQIFSIVNDLTDDKKKTMKDPFQILKNYRRDSTVFVCCGMHVALDPNEAYKTKSYAIQTSERMKKIHVSTLDQVYTEQFIFDLNHTKKGRKVTVYDDAKVITSEICLVECKNLRIKRTLERVNFGEIGRFQEPMDIEEEINEAKIKEQDLLLFLWNLYVNVNKRRPFIFPCPMNDKDQNLIKRILQLTEMTNLQPSDLISLLRLDPKVKIPKKFESNNFKLIPLERFHEQQPLPIYFSLRQRLAINNIQKDEGFLKDTQEKLINCSGCFNEQMLKSLSNNAINEQVADEDQKFVERFLKRKSGTTLQLFYFQMAKYYSRAKLTEDFVITMYEYLKHKAKTQFTPTPFQIYILQTTFDDVRHIFADADQKFFLNDQVSIKNEEDPNQGQQQVDPQQNNFRAFIKKITYHVNSQKKQNHTCHMCGYLFNKIQKATYGRLCLGCTNFVCYSCFDKKTGETALSQEQFQQCLVCQSKCDCQKCLKKRYKYQGGYSDFPSQKSAIFKSSNNVYNSTQNLRMNEEENLPKESKNLANAKSKGQPSQKGSLLMSNAQYEPIRAQPQSIPIQACWTCELQNRVDRIIRFECSVCKSTKCLTCEKSDNSKRNWVMRGSVLCNRCLENEQQTTAQQAELKILKSKIIALEHELVISKRQKFLSQSAAISNLPSKKNDNYADFSIVEEMNEHESQSNQQQRHEKGGATPMFDRSNKPKDSPVRYGRKNSSQNGSVASFGDNQQKTEQPKNQNQSRKRKNSSNSSGSKSIKSKRSNSAAKKEPKKGEQPSRRKNSSDRGSDRQSIASFKKKPSSSNNRQRSNSSKGSKCSVGSHKSITSKKSNPKGNNDLGSQHESGEYAESSSSQQKNKDQKRDWKKNHHQNNDDKEDFDGGRGGQRGGRGGDRGERGGRGGRGGYNRDNRDDMEDRDNRGNNNYGSSNRWQNNNRDDNRGGRGRNFDNNNNRNQGGGGNTDRKWGGNNNNRDNNRDNRDSNYKNNNNRDDTSFNNNRPTSKNDDSINDSDKGGYLLINIQNRSNQDDVEY